MSRKIPFAVGEYYHIYNRGVDKRSIFSREQDYERFKKLIFFCNNKKPIKARDFAEVNFAEGTSKRGITIIDIGAFCLMPNHFHMLIKEKIDGGVSNFMQKLLTAYTMYFNLRNSRSGALFESTFKSSHIDSDQYLKYMFAYIHLNPAKLKDKNWRENALTKDKKGGLYDFVKSYKYSSLPSYLDNTKEDSLILNYMAFPEYFSSKSEWENSITEWLSYPHHTQV